MYSCHSDEYRYIRDRFKNHTMIITIARQFGCGALAIGKRLAADYDIPFYTRKSLQEMAREKGVLDEMDDFFEERPVDELLFALSTLGEEAGPRHWRALDILTDMIGQRDCVIIGRCGNYIFRQRKDLVSVFLKGREADRVAIVAAERHISAEEAARLTHEMDDSRVRYHKYYTHLRWGDSSDYDLCFDSVRLGTDKSVALIERYIEGIGL